MKKLLIAVVALLFSCAGLACLDISPYPIVEPAPADADTADDAGPE